MNKQDLTTLIQNANSGDRRNAKAPPPLTHEEREAILYFFAKFKLLDPIAFDRAMPDERTEKATKTEFANSIRGFTKEQIDLGFAELKKLVGQNHPDYKFLSVAKLVGFVSSGGTVDQAPAGIYKLAPPVIKPPMALGSTLESMRANAVDVLNPQTGEYGIAVCVPKTTLTKADKHQAEKTLGRLNSLFEDDDK